MYVYIFIHKIPVSHYRKPVSERGGFKHKTRECLKIGVLLKIQWSFREKKTSIIFPVQLYMQSFKEDLYPVGLLLGEILKVSKFCNEGVFFFFYVHTDVAF